MMAAAASGGWLAIGALLAWAMLSPVIATAPSVGAVFTSPMMIVVLATIVPADRAVLVPGHAGRGARRN